MATARTAGVRAAALVTAALAAACGGSATGPTGGATSGSGGRSHNAGRDCMGCHGSEFGVAGTVYRADGAAYPGATVRLTTAAEGGGSVVLTLPTDGSGNFYTPQRVAFGSGLFTDVAGTNSRRTMKAAVTTGACNSCHDSSMRIVAD